MKKGRKQIVLLDVDNVLMPCTETACQVATARGIPVNVEEVTMYSFRNFEPETRNMLMGLFEEPGFFDNQVPYPGAVEMVQELVDAGHEVIIASAMVAQAMGTRAAQILKFFPMVDPGNIQLGSRKDLLHGDFLLDDSLNHIETSPAKYPVVFNQPWNRSAQGYLRANCYADFIAMVEQVSLMPVVELPKLAIAGSPGLICLVGPSASGKSFISDKLVENPMFKKVRALTTREPRDDSGDLRDYHFVTEEQFQAAIDGDDLVEYTVYAGHKYGIAKSEIADIWKDGRIAVKAMDINGAMACKRAYKGRCLSMFVRRSKEDIVRSLLERDIPNEDKARRLLTIDTEMENERLCDWTVSNNGSLEHAIQQILCMIG